MWRICWFTLCYRWSTTKRNFAEKSRLQSRISTGSGTFIICVIFFCAVYTVNWWTIVWKFSFIPDWKLICSRSVFDHRVDCFFHTLWALSGYLKFMSFSLHFYFFWPPCGRLSWLLISFWMNVNPFRLSPTLFLIVTKMSLAEHSGPYWCNLCLLIFWHSGTLVLSAER